MKSRMLQRRIGCLVGLILLVGVSAVSGQTLSIPTTGTTGSGSTLVDFEFRADGTLIEKGSGTSTLSTVNDVQSANRFFWYPALSALRAGAGSSTETASNMGQYSTALGQDAVATGVNSFAWGFYSTASGPYSTAGASGVAVGYASFAFGGASATMNNTVAFGPSSQAAANYSVVMGYGNHATSTAAGSVAMGFDCAVTGGYSVALGYHSTAYSYNETVLGGNNLGQAEGGGTSSATTWVAADPLLELGNGNTSASDAFVIYKNGDAAFPATTAKVTAATFVTTTPSGDIPMFTGN